MMPMTNDVVQAATWKYKSNVFVLLLAPDILIRKLRILVLTQPALDDALSLVSRLHCRRREGRFTREKLVKTVVLPSPIPMSIHPSVRLFARETSKMDSNDAEQLKLIPH